MCDILYIPIEDVIIDLFVKNIVDVVVECFHYFHHASITTWDEMVTIFEM